eukprot:1918369-Amphidinium_carterae.1
MQHDILRSEGESNENGQMQNDILRSESNESCRCTKTLAVTDSQWRVQLDGKIRYMSTSVVDNHSGWLEIASLRASIALILALLSWLAHALSTDAK